MMNFKNLETEIKRLESDIKSCEIKEIRPLWNNEISVKNPKEHLLEHLRIIKLMIEDIKNNLV